MHLSYIHKSKKRFHSFREHTHAFWEIMLITDGRGTVFMQGKPYPVEKGSVLCIPPGIPHRSVSEEGMQDFCAAFEEFPIFQKKELKILYDDSGDCERILDILLHSVRRVPENQKELIDSLGNSLAQLLMAMLADNEHGSAAVCDLKKLMMDHLNDENFNVGEALRNSDFSEGYLRRMFRQTTGMSPVQWLNRQRIEYAERCLCQFADIYTIKQISAASGYSDPYYFSRIFKKYTGMSPRQYIKAFKGDDPAGKEYTDEEVLQNAPWTDGGESGTD